MPAKTLGVRWLRKALANLEAHAQYIAKDNPTAARRVVAAIERAVARLADYPGLGRPGRVEGTRELVVSGTPHIVPYRVRGQTVEILRVLHAAPANGRPLYKPGSNSTFTRAAGVWASGSGS